MAFSIGDLLFSFRGDSSLLKKDAEKAAGDAGDAAGKTFSQKFASGVKVAAGGFAGGFAGAAIGATISRLGQLERATADFRRETGATAEEATKAGKAINDMAGRNIQSVEEIGRTLTSVTVQWGLHGDAAEAAAEKVLKFAQATGMEAEAAVNGLDNVMDTWNLTAADSQALMDKLIVSHQRWGGDIAQNIDSLAGLAPALQAANFKIEDGIALLGLFGSKGLDANQGAAAFAKALTKVKSPAELQSLITDISNTDDAFTRARKAADLFGARAGAKLANALGGVALDDYKVSMEDAAGATDKAADASLTMADKVKMAFSNITSTVVDFMGPAGPFLQGIAGLTTLMGPAITKLGAAVGAAIGAMMGPQLIAAIAAIAPITIPVVLAVGGLVWLSEQHGIEETASKVLAENVQKNIDLIRQQGTAVTGMGKDQVRAIYFVTDALKDQAAAIIKKDGLADAVRQAMEWDTNAGLTAQDIQAINDEGDQAYKALYGGILAAVGSGPGVGGAVVDGLQKDIVGWFAKQPAQGPVAQAYDNWYTAQLKAGQQTAAHHQAADILGPLLADEKAHAAIHDRGRGIGFTFVEGVTNAIHESRRVVRKEAGQVGQSIGDGLRAEKSAIHDAMIQLKYEMQHPITQAEVEAYAAGRLHSKRLADGIRSNIPAIRQAAIRAWAAARITDSGFVLDSHGRVKDGHNAAGTRDWRGGWSWTGERGPELEYLPPHTQVFDTQTSMAMAKGASNKRVDFYVHDSDGGLARAGIGTAALANALRRWED